MGGSYVPVCIDPLHLHTHHHQEHDVQLIASEQSPKSSSPHACRNAVVLLSQRLSKDRKYSTYCSHL